MFGMKGFYVSASGAIQGNHGSLVCTMLPTVLKIEVIILGTFVISKCFELGQVQNLSFVGLLFSVL